MKQTGPKLAASPGDESGNSAGSGDHSSCVCCHDGGCGVRGQRSGVMGGHGS